MKKSNAMILSPRWSKFLLTSHISFSLGWFGAVAVFLVLAITGLTSPDIQLVRARYLAMELSAWFIIVPFCVTSLITGIAQAYFTKWGLLKHYWIVVKLFLTVMSTILLLLHLEPISYLAKVARNSSFTNIQYSGQLINLIGKTGAAILALLIMTTISIYKPWGKIQSKQNFNQPNNMQEKNKKSISFYILIGLLALIIIFITMHLLGGGMKGH